MNTSYQKPNSKSFYIVLSLSVIALIAAAIGITFTTKRVKNVKENVTESTIDWDNNSFEITKQANEPTHGVEDTRNSTATEKTEKDDSETENSKNNAGKETTAKEETTEYAKDCCLPVGTQILKDYSNGIMVKSKTMNDWRLHNGVDFSGEDGSEVKAVRGGTVIDVYTDSMWGNVVEIDHGDSMIAKYCGLDDIRVSKDDNVSGEQVIGILGEIPVESADAPHLHLEILKDGTVSDPLTALGRNGENE